MPCKRVSLSIGALLGNLDGVRFLGLLRERKKYIWIPFLDPEGIKILVWGPSGTLVKERDFPELISDYGSQRACL